MAGPSAPSRVCGQHDGHWYFLPLDIILLVASANAESMTVLRQLLLSAECYSNHGAFKSRLFGCVTSPIILYLTAFGDLTRKHTKGSNTSHNIYPLVLTDTLNVVTRNILDCDQSNYSSRIIFSCRLFLQAAL